MNKLVNIRFSSWIFKLTCLYAFFIPLEKILEVLFDIDTVFKPYRVIGLLIVTVFVIRSCFKWQNNSELKRDIFLYSIFIYGLIVTLVRMMTQEFTLKYFISDSFQFGLYLCVFIVLRHSGLSRNNYVTICKFLATGILVNALYVFYSFVFLKSYMRHAGFMDNPNYMALSLVFIGLMFLVRRPQLKGWVEKMLGWCLFAFIAYVFIISGSRTGLALMLICGAVAVYYSSIREKLIILSMITMAGLLITFKASEHIQQTGPLILIKRLNKKTTDDPRLPVWGGAIRAAASVNFTGLGIGQFKARFHEFFYDENNPLIIRMINRGYFLSPHSDYFFLLAVHGIVGLVLYLIFLVTTGLRVFQSLKSTQIPITRMYYQFSLATFLALVLFGLTSENFNSALYWTILSVSTKIDFG